MQQFARIGLPGLLLQLAEAPVVASCGRCCKFIASGRNAHQAIEIVLSANPNQQLLDQFWLG